VEKSPLSGLSGGSDFCNDSNNSKNGKTKSKTSTKKGVKEYFVYKYNKDILLAEQIILGNKSVFLQISSDGIPITSVGIDLRKEQGILLAPQQDGINGVASFTLPIKFRDHKEIKDFIELAKRENIDSIFLKHKALWEKFVVATDERTLSFLAIDSAYSWFQDLFETTHFDLIDGPPGSGKGATLITFQLLGYRVVLAADLSGANILDLYGCNGRCQITVAEDELDDIENDPIKRKMYKIGYDLTGKTTRTLDGNTSNRTNRLYEIFGFKIFGTEIASDDKTLGGFNDRNFRIENTKSKPMFRVKKVLLEMEKPLEKQSPKYRQIVEEVEYIRKLTFIFRMIHHNDMIEEVETNIDGRPLELTGPQIYLFASKELGSAYGLASTREERQKSLLVKEILPSLTHFLEKKGQLTERTIQSVVCDALKRLMIFDPEDKLIHNTVNDVTTGKTREIMQVAYELIYEEVKNLTDGKDPINPNEQAFYSVEYGKITHRQILNICKNPFRGEYGRINFQTNSQKTSYKTMTFDKDIISKVGKGLEAITEIKILDPEEEAESTEVLNSTLYAEQGKKDSTNQPEVPDHTTQENDDIRKKEEQDLGESQDAHTDSKNNANVENGLDDDVKPYNKNIPCTSTAQNSVLQYSNNDPDPSLAETTRYLSNFRAQEAKRAVKKSNVA
jgi:hypothetical protein